MEQSRKQTDTIIYGGAFNPPTRAHQAILQACVDRAERTGADVWLLPSGDRTDKTIEVSRDDRLRMLDALISDVLTRTVTIHVDTSELDQAKQTETYDTVTRLSLLHMDRRFVWVFGSDSVTTMAQWRHGEWLVDNLPMLIVERPGVPIEELGRYATRLDVDTLATSSTDVKRRLAAQEPVDHLVTPSVMKLLVK